MSSFRVDYERPETLRGSIKRDPTHNDRFPYVLTIDTGEGAYIWNSFLTRALAEEAFARIAENRARGNYTIKRTR